MCPDEASEYRQPPPICGAYTNSRLLSMVTFFDPAMLLLVSYDAVTAVSSMTVMGIWGFVDLELELALT